MAQLTSDGVDRQEACCSNQAAWTPARQPSWQWHHDHVGGGPVRDVVTERNMLACVVFVAWTCISSRLSRCTPRFRTESTGWTLAFPKTTFYSDPVSPCSDTDDPNAAVAAAATWAKGLGLFDNSQHKTSNKKPSYCRDSTRFGCRSPQLAEPII